MPRLFSSTLPPTARCGGARHGVTVRLTAHRGLRALGLAVLPALLLAVVSVDATSWAQPATPPGSGAPPAAATAAPSSIPTQAAPAQSTPAAAKHLFKLEGTLESDGSAQAVAINADESLLAVAKEDGSTTEVLIFDRPSRTRIGVIDAKVGSH